jgi:outer membrane biosynthesis protein TonB
MKEQHLLVDYENVQPSIDDLLKLAPKLTDVWLFHGPNQVKRAQQLQAAHERVTLVPHSGKGKNALDFHLSFYLGYVAAKHPAASLVVVANDKGYDSMIAHAKDLGFTASRVGFKAKKVAAAKKTTVAAAPVKKAAAPARKKPVTAAPAPAPAAAKAVPAKKTAKKAAPAKKTVPAKPLPKASPTPKPVVKAAPAQTPAARKAPAKNSATKTIPAKKAPAKKAAAPAAPTLSDADKAFARAKTALAKMGKNRPTKFAALLRHLKSIVGQGATEADANALSHRLEQAKVLQVVGGLVLYP